MEMEKIESHLLRCLNLPALRICIDLSYFDENNRRECVSLGKQLSLTYHSLKKSSIPIGVYLTCFQGAIVDYLKLQGADKWIIHRHPEEPWKVFPFPELVYLSPDAEDVLTDLDDGKVRYMNTYLYTLDSWEDKLTNSNMFVNFPFILSLIYLQYKLYVSFEFTFQCLGICPIQFIARN